MKIALIKPIYKKEVISLFINYRPIPILPQVSKILEKLIENRMNSFFIKYHITITIWFSK